jgi:hypothetical protein
MMILIVRLPITASTSFASDAYLGVWQALRSSRTK